MTQILWIILEEDEILVWRIMIEEEEFVEGLQTSVNYYIGQEENL